MNNLRNWAGELTFRSSVEGIVWPAVPENGPLALLPLILQLEQSQWWSAEGLRKHQFHQLSRLLAHAYRTVPFYRDRLSLVGFEPDRHLGSEFLARIPILRRTEVQGAGDALLSENIPEDHGKTREIFTSGSTGKPIRALLTKVRDRIWDAITIRDEIWHSRDPKGKLAVIRTSTKGAAPYPTGSQVGWPRMAARTFETGPIVSLNVNCSVEQQADWLAREEPDYLLTFPSIAHRLADYCLEKGIRFQRLREIETITERLQPATRAACRKAFGVPVVDIYSAREVGYIALQCPKHEHYHIQSEVTFVEVLDDGGRPCGPGEQGQVVVTPLHNFAMPFIRYEIGDVVEVGGHCPCGRGLPVITRILGRRQERVLLPNGEERWPLLASGDIDRLLATAPIRQHQLVQTALDAMELRVVVRRPLTSEETEGLCDWVRRKFEFPFRVAVVCKDDIPRTTAGKFRDFVSEINA